MQIRKKLTYQFISIVALILLFASLAIYFSSSNYRKDDFYNRMISRGTNMAKLLIEVEEVDADLLKRIETDNPQGLPEEKILIYNYKDELLFTTDDEQALHVDKGLLDEIRLEDEMRYTENKHEVVGFMFTDTYDRFVIIVGAKDIYGIGKLKNLRNILFLVFSTGIIIISLTGWFYAGRALAPISKVVNQVDNIGITSLNLRLDEGDNDDEISKLAQTFNKMLSRLESAFKVQKNFIANASHELRTPLTAITGQLEVILMKKRNEDEYRESIDSVLDDIKKLNVTSNRLLLLAQASSEAARLDFHPLRIDDLIWQARAELLKRNPGYHINVEFDDAMEDEGQLTLTGNEQLLKTAILNLMENGCKYSDDHQVKVLIVPGEIDFKLLFSDRGIGIHPDEIKYVFEPFKRGSNALTFKGHGIGLSLTQRIVDLHNGNILVESQPGKGSTFEIIIPYAARA